MLSNTGVILGFSEIRMLTLNLRPLYLLSKFVWVLFFTGQQSATVDERVNKQSAELGLIPLRHNYCYFVGRDFLQIQQEREWQV